MNCDPAESLNVETSFKDLNWQVIKETPREAGRVSKRQKEMARDDRLDDLLNSLPVLPEIDWERFVAGTMAAILGSER